MTKARIGRGEECVKRGEERVFPSPLFILYLGVPYSVGIKISNDLLKDSSGRPGLRA